MSLTIFKIIISLTVFFLTRYASLNRDSKFTFFFFGKHGPIPEDFEPKYRYMYRWALYSFSWCVILTYIFYFFVVEIQIDVYSDENVIVLTLFALVLPLLIGTSLLAFLGALVRAIWNYLFNRTELLMEEGNIKF